METIKNVAVIGYPNMLATILISELEKMPDRFFLVPETIGNIDLKFIKFRIGVNGKEVTVFRETSLDIFLKYLKLTVIDFDSNKQRRNYFNRNKIRFIVPSNEATVEGIIDLI